MAKKPLLTKETIKTRYPNEWLLLEDYELDASTTLRKARVLAHSKDRDAIHRALKKGKGNLCVHYTGTVDPDTEIIFLMPESSTIPLSHPLLST
jgi:hypothetical protein